MQHCSTFKGDDNAPADLDLRLRGEFARDRSQVPSSLATATLYQQLRSEQNILKILGRRTLLTTAVAEYSCNCITFEQA